MTKEEYEKKIAELQAQIDELKNAQIEDAPPHPRWVPSDGDTYYVIGTCGDVYIQDWTSINNEIDKSRLSCGNVFKTRAETEFAAAQRIVLAEMQEWAGNFNDAFMLTCDVYRNKVFCIPAGDAWVHGELRFATKEDAKGCIKAVGEERLKKYYFMIPEV